MAKRVIESVVDVYWTDSKNILNSNFTELYGPDSVTTTATPATGSCGIQWIRCYR